LRNAEAARTEKPNGIIAQRKEAAKMIKDNMALWAVIMHDKDAGVLVSGWGEREIVEKWAAYWEKTFPGDVSILRNVNDQRLYAD
jgi:hypothetical protein